ncbi:endogenous retrovirus group V member 2 Env polyprotein-like [Sciurus carolinensis]|uniref:endogenous retrovirus group V member 2 Env polyprotein-like n=1 Tax=Sciurus carolinensis TaxID=30640 RepID=UPI001FB43FAD|nr:endogenous retrovirus group V member 2 Env polyprotein-like [Sciurus carolinensis]XP_047407917.1 endogenous retrovirus group V member 2 Env polyprotein-like [Sciurus carolinensis]XP_047407918.1 endogenous retrovirus group V member 2 Env polyprotein-like [Sciurus carolinensis]
MPRVIIMWQTILLFFMFMSPFLAQHWQDNFLYMLTQDVLRGNNLTSECWICHRQLTQGGKSKPILEGIWANETDIILNLPYRANATYPNPTIKIAIPTKTPTWTFQPSALTWWTNIAGSNFSHSRNPRCGFSKSSSIHIFKKPSSAFFSCDKIIDSCCNKTGCYSVNLPHHSSKPSLYNATGFSNCTCVPPTLGCESTWRIHDHWKEWVDSLHQSMGNRGLLGLLKNTNLSPLSKWTSDPSLVPKDKIDASLEPGLLCLPRGMFFMTQTQSHLGTYEGYAVQCIDWKEMTGTWGIGYVVSPADKIQVFTNDPQGTVSTLHRHRTKRGPGLVIAGVVTLIGSLIGLAGGITYNAVTAKNIAATMGDIAIETGQDFKLLAKSLDSLAQMVIENRLALDYLLAQEGGVCALANTSCCFYVNVSGQIETSAEKILQKAVWLKAVYPGNTKDIWETINSYLPNFTWLLPLLGPLVTILLFLLFGPCLFNLLIKFVSSRLRQLHVKTMTKQGFRPISTTETDLSLFTVNRAGKC